MAGTNTTSSAGQKAVRAVSGAASTADLQRFMAITKEMLQQYFPRLSKIPDILYVCMSIWGLESSFKLWHMKTTLKGDNAYLNGYDSCHLSPADSSKGMIGKYWRSAEVQNLLRTRGDDINIVTALHQGRVAQGLSAVMGCYYIRNNPFNDEIQKYKSLLADLDMQVDPGQKVTDLFPNNEVGERRSIGSGIMILDLHYGYARGGVKTDSEGLTSAVSRYVGKAGAKDINGYSPEDRVRDVYGKPTTLSSRLARELGLTRSGYVPANPPGTSTEDTKVAKATQDSKANATKPTTSENKQTHVASTSTPMKIAPPGCS